MLRSTLIEELQLDLIHSFSLFLSFFLWCFIIYTSNKERAGNNNEKKTPLVITFFC